MPSAQLLNGLFLPGARLENPGGVALAGGAVVASSVDCSQGFTAQGEVRLPRTRIGGLLTFEGAHLDGGRTGTALDCVSMSVGEFDHRFAAPPSGDSLCLCRRGCGGTCSM
ncbi:MULTISPECIES: hypothetical protein [unclassified Streptomyces]|uniref:hypothetical protein n=1 Tax=unclassified Streptomyces TaxID=2593676 RepID=UPI00203576C7|nr:MULTISPECIES: hypothetical protein [unclassified Streptomyces]